MSSVDITWVDSDNLVTRRERRRQSAYREEVLGLPAGTRGNRPLGNYLPADDRTHNFLSAEAAAYAEQRVVVVRREGGQLDEKRLFTNMLSSMPLCFSVFGHLRAHPTAAVAVLRDLLGRDIVALESASVRSRVIQQIECEWAPERRNHLDDGSAFDAVVAARLEDGRRLLVAVETKYIDAFSRDPKNATKDAKYRGFCERFGMAEGAFDALKGTATRQLLRNVLLTESVRRGGEDSQEGFDDAVTVVLARDDDDAARRAVLVVQAYRGHMPTDVTFVGHGRLADAAARVSDLAAWAADFRRRYVVEADP
jgi:hypothetical protein